MMTRIPQAKEMPGLMSEARRGHVTFEQFLKEQHAIQYQGLDDDMPDGFENWLEGLNGSEYMEYGEQYGRFLKEVCEVKIKGK